MQDKNDNYWQKKLTPEQYRILRQKGTETPGSGQFLRHKANGMYTCAACGAELFKSDDKYDSTTPGLIGWPSFAAAKDSKAVTLAPDNTAGMSRMEAICVNCGGHLGHIFDDASASTGKHYCINSCALDFRPKTDASNQ